MNDSYENTPDGFEDNEDFRYRECYTFSTALDDALDDERCIHCAHFLTLSCKYIEEFIDEEEE